MPPDDIEVLARSGIHIPRLSIAEAWDAAFENPLVAERIHEDVLEGKLVAMEGWWGCPFFMVRGEPPEWLLSFGATEKDLGDLVEAAQQPGKRVEFGDVRPPAAPHARPFRPVPIESIIGAADDFLAVCEVLYPDGAWGWVEAEGGTVKHLRGLPGLFVRRSGEERVAFLPPIQGKG